MRPSSAVICALLLCALVQQSLSLPYAPIPDSQMWAGDEIWQMLQVKHMLGSGAPVIEESAGSTLADGIGFMAGSSWISALFYGFTFRLLDNDLITSGRIASLLVGVMLIGYLSYSLRSQGVSPIIALLASFLLAVSPAFWLATHSARRDILASLSLFASVVWLSRQLTSPKSNRSLIVFALLPSLNYLVYIHSTSLLILPWLWVGFKLRIHRNVREALEVVSITVGSFVALGVLYYLTTGHFGLYGDPSEGRGQYDAVVSSIPLFHPFSPEYQYISIFLRLKQWYELMWPVLFLLPLAICFHKKVTASIIPFALACISPFLFQGPAVFYAIYPLPFLSVLFAMATNLKGTARWESVVPVSITAVVFVYSLFVTDASRSRQLSLQNRAAADSLLRLVNDDEKGRKPRILADVGVAQIVAATNNVNLVTHHFLWFPLRPPSIPEFDYWLGYQGSVVSDIVRGDELVAYRVGQFRQEDPRSVKLDTLFLRRRSSVRRTNGIL